MPTSRLRLASLALASALAACADPSPTAPPAAPAPLHPGATPRAVLVSAPGGVRVTPRVLDFGDVQVGTAAPSQVVQVTNVGTTSWRYDGAGGGVDAPFGAAQNCAGRTLAPGESCQVVYDFRPGAVGPAATASDLWMAGASHVVSLRGTGVAPSVRVSPTGFDFGAAVVGSAAPTQTVEVTNTGTAPWRVDMAGGGIDAPFGGAQNCAGRTLAPGESCQIGYGFSAPAVGAFTGSTSVWLAGRTVAFEMLGAGYAAGTSPAQPIRVSPTTFDFGDVPVGTKATQIVEVTNTGAGPWTFDGAGGGAPDPFMGGQNCAGKTLAPGTSCQIHYWFTPPAAGDFEGSTAVYFPGRTVPFRMRGRGVGPSIRVTPTGFDFGQVAVGSTSAPQVAVVTNVGRTAWAFDGAGGGIEEPFQSGQACAGKTLAPGASCTVTFWFKPTTAGTATRTTYMQMAGREVWFTAQGTGVVLGTVRPTARFVAPTEVVAGTAFTLALTDAQVPGQPQETAFTYAFDCGVGGLTTPSTTPSVACPTSTTGTRTVRARVTDRANDYSEYSATVWVRGPWTFTGFASPTLDPPALNSASAGGKVSVRFALGGDFGLAILAAGFPSVTPVRCDTFAATGASAPAEGAAKVPLAYDATTRTYAYAWKTARAWAGGCRKLTVRLTDGAERSAIFRMR